jgi:hypothetical protein
MGSSGAQRKRGWLWPSRKRRASSPEHSEPQLSGHVVQPSVGSERQSWLERERIAFIAPFAEVSKGIAHATGAPHANTVIWRKGHAARDAMVMLAPAALDSAGSGIVVIRGLPEQQAHDWVYRLYAGGKALVFDRAALRWRAIVVAATIEEIIAHADNVKARIAVELGQKAGSQKVGQPCSKCRLVWLDEVRLAEDVLRQLRLDHHHPRGWCGATSALLLGRRSPGDISDGHEQPSDDGERLLVGLAVQIRHQAR